MTDADWLWRALAFAEKGRGHTRPNPPVGAVLVKGEKLLGGGYHHRCGQPHAEVMALRDARRRLGAHAFGDLSNATLYVTLEPCSKPGRVGACTDAIAPAGVGRVVYAAADPNPTNRGKAKRALARHGISCELFRGDKAVSAAAKELIAPFAKHVTTGLPFVTVKVAMSLDGKICDSRGDAKWISSARSRRFTGELRAVSDAILVGAETVRKDNPSLLCHSRRNDDLLRAVVSKSGRLPKTAQVFTDAARERTLVYDDPVEAIRDLGRRGCLSVVCEGGLTLARALAEAGLVDRWLAVVAPVVIGSRPMAQAVRGTVDAAASAVRFGDGFLTVDFA